MLTHLFSMAFVMRFAPSLYVLVLGCFVLPACHADSTVTPAQIEALVKKTTTHLSFVEGGTFMMGDFGSEHGEEKLPYVEQRVGARPLHKVTLDSFSMMQYKVTYADFDVYSAAKGLPKVAEFIGISDMGTKTPNDPADRQPDMPAMVTWSQAQDYCRWLGQQAGLPMDLPTEAQWEYAARNRGQFVVLATANGQLDEEGRYVPTPAQRDQLNGEGGTGWYYPVGRFPASPLGLYDMGYAGQDWTQDWFDVEYYEHSPERNPTGPASGTEKVVRGSPSIGSTPPMQELTMWRSHRLPEATSGKTDRPGDVKGRGTARCVVNAQQAVKR